MSVNYSASLSPYEDKGVLGLPETHEDEASWQAKAAQLAAWLREAQGLAVAHTGAGVSTAAGIPDFRGPRGVWTLERDGRQPEFGAGFDEARPTLTHAALAALERAGWLSFLVTQNVDGLHLRSGFPRNRMAILHGDMFVEECGRCRAQFVRSSCVPCIGRRPTGATCGARRRGGACGGALRDTVLDWEHSLPRHDLRLAQRHSRAARLSVALGTSLQIVPAADLPPLCRRSGGRLAIVNLQPTKKDSVCDLRIGARCDLVMERLCQLLGVQLPSVVDIAPVQLKSVHTQPRERMPWRIFLPTDSELLPADCKQESVDCKQESVDCKQESVDCKQDSVDCKQESVDCKQDSGDCKQDSVDCKQDSVGCKRNFEYSSENGANNTAKAGNDTAEAGNDTAEAGNDTAEAGNDTAEAGNDTAEAAVSPRVSKQPAAAVVAQPEAKRQRAA